MFVILIKMRKIADTVLDFLTGAVKRCFKCRSRGELGDCRNPDEGRSLANAGRNPFAIDRDQSDPRGGSSTFNTNFESWSGIEAVPCSSGWCAKVIEGKGTFKAEGNCSAVM